MSFNRKWILANTTAMFVSYLVYTPIAHGITGGHGHYLTPKQVIAHTIALALVALVVFLSQRHVLREYINISWLRIIISTVAFIVLFWIGYYQKIIPDGPDTDILLGYLILGSGMWFGKIHAKRHWLATIIAVLSFPFASFIGEVLLILAVSGLNLDFNIQSNEFHHTLFWLVIGVTTGLLGGWIGGLALSNMIKRQEI